MAFGRGICVLRTLFLVIHTFVLLHCERCELMHLNDMDEIPLFMELHEHGGESRDLNDREFRAGIQTKQVNKIITLFLIPNRFS